MSNKKIADIFLLILFFGSLSSTFFSETIHEICGLVFLAAVFIHNFFNRNFYNNFSKRGTLNKFCVVFFAAALIILTVSGIMLWQAADNFNWRSVHLTAAICSVVLLFVHLLTHARKYIHGKIFYATAILAFIFAVAGIVSVTVSDNLDYCGTVADILSTSIFILGEGRG